MTAQRLLTSHGSAVRRSLGAVGLLGISAVLLAGCGSSSSTAGGSSPATSSSPSATSSASTSPSAAGSPSDGAAASTSPSAAASASTRAASMSIKDYKYTVPTSVTPGAKVTIMNNDPEAHSVTADSGSAFAVVVPAGGTASFTAPTKAGSYAFHCIFHSNMHGTLVVK